MRRILVLCLTSILAGSSAAMAGLRGEVEQEKATVSRSVQVSPNSFLGVELGDVNSDSVQRLKLREERGALIEGITSGSSAAQAGLQKNDVIIKWDGERIESARELSRHIRETPAGRNVRLGVIRDGREIEVNVKLGERASMISRPRIAIAAPIVRSEIRAEAARVREEARAATARVREETRASAARAREAARASTVRLLDQVRSTGRLGVQLQSMTPQLAEYFGLSKRTGSLVVFVYADSPAAKAGLKAGDVILSAGSQKVENPTDLRRALIDKPEGALDLRILRDKREQNVTVQVEKRSGSLLVMDDDCSDSIIHAAIAPMEIHVPHVAIAPMHIQVPKVALAPIKVQVPQIKIAPIAVPAVKVDIAPMKIDVPEVTIAPIAVPAVKVDLAPMHVTVPKLKIDPVKIVVVPRRVVL